VIQAKQPEKPDADTWPSSLEPDTDRESDTSTNIGVVMYQTSCTKGQELVAQRMASELARQGHRTFLITGPYHDNIIVNEYDRLQRSIGGYLLYEKNEFEVPLVRVDGFISTWPPRRIMFRDFLSVLRRLSERFSLDTIISHSTLWNGPEEITKFVTWKRMLKAQGLDEVDVVYAHMSHYQPPDPMRYDIVERAFRITWNNMLFPHIFRTAKVILCTTPLEIEQMVALGAGREQCHLYPGGVDQRAFERYWTKNPVGFLEKHSIPADAKLVTYLGTIEERKNPLAVVRVAKALKGLKDVHFVIAGYPSNQVQQVNKEAKELKTLSYIGTLTEEEKVALIRSSYVNILLSRSEALGLTQLEFMYGGVPVVTSAVGGQRWLVQDGVHGIHVRGPEDVNGATEAVRRLVNNIALRDELGKNARNRAQEFTLARITSELHSRLTSLRAD